MAWKKDDKGNLAVDEHGNPVWTTDSGEDKAVDYPAMVKRISDINAESKGRKEEIKALKEKYALFDGIEDLSTWKEEALKAIELQKNAPEKDKELEAQIAARVESATAGLKAQIAAKDKTLAERDKALAEQDTTIRSMAINADVKGSKILMERIKPEFRPLLERELVRAGALDDEKKVYYRNAKGEPLYGETGTYATREEAPLMLLKELGIDAATVLLSQDGGTTGSGGKPGGSQHFNATGKSLMDCKTKEEKETWLRNVNNLKQPGVK